MNRSTVLGIIAIIFLLFLPANAICNPAYQQRSKTVLFPADWNELPLNVVELSILSA